MKKCSECVYCIHADYGYSNYTTEGTSLYCYHDKNPSMPFDRWYGHDKRDIFAEECPLYIEGDGVYIDVDREGPNSEYPNEYIPLDYLLKERFL